MRMFIEGVTTFAINRESFKDASKNDLRTV